MTCAYCGSTATATREHVIPRFLYKAGGAKTARDIDGWNISALKRVAGEATIRDVCSACNSGPLAELDDYGKTFLNAAGLLATNYPRSRLAIRYDFGKLLRWLLKLTYNSSRSSGQHTAELAPFRGHILDPAVPLPCHAAIVACMLKGVAVEDLPSLQPEQAAAARLGDGRWRPFFVRLSYLLLPDAFAPVVVRACTFGCLSIFVVLDAQELPRCVIRAMPVHDSAACRATDSAACRSIIPRHAGPGE